MEAERPILGTPVVVTVDAGVVRLSGAAYTGLEILIFMTAMGTGDDHDEEDEEDEEEGRKKNITVKRWPAA